MQTLRGRFRGDARWPAFSGLAALTLRATLCSALVASSAAAGGGPISVVGDQRSLVALAEVEICPPLDPGCATSILITGEDEDEATQNTFDAEVEARAAVDSGKGEGGDAESLCEAQQTSDLTMMLAGETAVLELHATGSASTSSSVIDPNAPASFAECISDSFLEVSFTLEQPARVQLVASVTADILQADLFSPGDPLVGALWNGAFATLLDATDVDPKDPMDEGEVVYDSLVRDEGDTDSKKGPLADGMPVLGALDESSTLEPGTYVFSVGAGTRVFGFENGHVRAGSAFDVALTVTVPEPGGAALRLAALAALVGLAARRRGRA